MASCCSIDGPWTRSPCVWVEVNNLKRLETRVVEGPCIHHVAAIHGEDVVLDEV